MYFKTRQRDKGSILKLWVRGLDQFPFCFTLTVRVLVSLINLHWLPVTHRIEFKIAMLVHKCIYGVAPQYLSDLIKIKESSRYQLRSYRGILLMDNTYRTKKTLGDRVFENAAPKVWNRLPLEIRQCQSLNIFKVLLKTHLFKLAFY